MALWSVEIRIN
jgi:hypothetical protein